MTSPLPNYPLIAWGLVAAALTALPNHARAAPNDAALDESTHTDDAFRHVVVLGLGTDFESRVLGHTSDISARVTSRQEPPMGSWREQGERAREIAKSDDAELVAWLAEMPGPPDELATTPARTFVAIFLADSDRLYTHPVGPALSQSEMEQRSATLELAALTVRAALQSLDEPDPLGIPLSDVQPDASTQQEPDVTPLVSPVQAPSTAPLLMEAVFTAGATVHVDGVTQLGLPAIRLGLGLRRRSVSAVVVGEWGAARRRPSADAILSVQRFFLGLEAQLELGRFKNLSPYAALSLGASGFHRTTLSEGPTLLAAAPSTSWSPTAVLGLGLAWDLGANWLDQRLGVRGGIAVVPAAPIIELRDEQGAPTTRYGLWSAQPYAGLEWTAIW